MKFQILFAILLAFVLSTSCSSEKRKNKHTFTVAFYNVENLFDLLDEPGKSDEEFMPESEKKWTAERYQIKLDTLARVLSSINKNELPEIIGMCEVENKTVLEDLVQTKFLASGKYKIVHYESPDFRGIDCALIYRPDEFEVIKSFPISVNFISEPDYSTRDILYVKGKTRKNEVLHVFVNHWSSRIGGLEQTEPKRMETASILKSKIDSIQLEDKSANIIIIGDMNDEPSNKSLAQVLNAQDPEKHQPGLVNLMYPAHNNKLGSYFYRGNWNMLDNIVVSTSLLDNKGLQCVDKSGHVFREPWMEFKNKAGEISPSRTYGGPNYYGGLSDHFPVYFTLQN